MDIWITFWAGYGYARATQRSRVQSIAWAYRFIGRRLRTVAATLRRAEQAPLLLSPDGDKLYA